MIALLAPPAIAAALSAPSFLAVSRASRRRPFAPLVRGSLERCCVLAAAGLAAASVSASVVLLAGFRFPIDQLDSAAVRLFFLFAPPVIGLAPWTAGEILSGASARQEESFAASLAAAYFAAVLAFGTAIPAGTAVALAAAGSAATICSAAIYLRSRGPLEA
ncbi:MAG TPA: hypothetical protein VLW85_11505 [Myxococcales bacterium]|nr:hypothetical protein [Myxococcales bacterium]